ncbi:MAG TPA: hypothetical protein VIL46_11750, partial [Gemmataceae bacterium]
LELGDPNSPLCTADGTDAVALVQKNPRLRKLVLLARNIDTETLFTLPMPQLERLWVDFGARYPLRRLAENASLRNLTHLWLDPRPEYPLAPVNPGEMDELELVEAIMEREQSTDLTPEVHTPEEVDSFFASPNFPKVAHLRLRLTGIGDWACEAVVRHGWLRRLETLDLCQTGMTDEGAHALARCPDLGRLKQLDVQGNRLTRDGIAALERADIRLHARYQIGGAGYPEDDDFGFGGGPTGIEVIDL